ncbi:MFS transporter [Buttiauxella selenatireducens]|uniref:MFS transporter n=1 Tax=Buttiauxella selenatireducens TaxID=3073902 RepID=A0ABY9SAU4_9ENTR|nr:MFS transporter [Buttiauxella sp. R73]WMY74627.1 MFS transporter [Buttiauxella sp. R73]
MNKKLVVPGMVFFLWGSVTAINSTLVLFFHQYFKISWQEAILINVLFYLAPFIACLPCSALISRWGYRTVLRISLAVTALGCLALALALQGYSFSCSLLAVFVVAIGVSAMQVVANPYLALLSAPHKRSGNLSLASAMNSVGTTLGPLFVAFLLQRNPVNLAAHQEPISQLWLALALFSGLLILISFAVKLPDVERPLRLNQRVLELWKYKCFVFSVIAIFCYVGVEVSLATSVVNYLSTIGLWEMDQAMSLVAIYWGGALAGRLLFGFFAHKLNIYHSFLFATLFCSLCVMLAIFFNNGIGGVLLLLTGLGNAIMYPVIFSRSIKEISHLANIAAAVLVMAGIGGAIIPYLQAVIIDEIGLRISFILPMVLYFILVMWGYFQLRDD